MSYATVSEWCRRIGSSIFEKIYRVEGQTDFSADPAALENTDAFRLERRATDLRGLLIASPVYRQTGRDRTARFLVV